MYDFVQEAESEEAATEGLFPEDRLAQLYYAHAMSQGNAFVERERRLDVFKWEWMEEASFFDYFSVEKLFSFLIKVQIIERWISLDAEAGGELLRSMIQQLKEEVKVPQEFTINNKK